MSSSSPTPSPDLDPVLVDHVAAAIHTARDTSPWPEVLQRAAQDEQDGDLTAAVSRWIPRRDDARRDARAALTAMTTPPPGGGRARGRGRPA